MKCINILLIAALGMFASNCGNDFLDVKPTNAVVDDDNMITTNAELQAAVNGAYTYLEYYRVSTMLQGDVMGDDLQSYPWDYRLELYYCMDQRTVNYTDMGLWVRLYSGAFDINTVLDKVKNIKEQNDDTKRMVAELRFIRAFLHWDASLRYGPLPSNLGKGNIKQDALGVMITDKLPEDIQGVYYRDKVSDVFAFMIREMEEIVGDLPTENRHAALTYWAGKMFLARLYLYTEQWDKAFDCAAEVISSGRYALYAKEDI